MRLEYAVRSEVAGASDSKATELVILNVDACGPHPVDQKVGTTLRWRRNDRIQIKQHVSIMGALHNICCHMTSLESLSRTMGSWSNHKIP